MEKDRLRLPGTSKHGKLEYRAFISDKPPIRACCDDVITVSLEPSDSPDALRLDSEFYKVGMRLDEAKLAHL